MKYGKRVAVLACMLLPALAFAKPKSKFKLAKPSAQKEAAKVEEIKVEETGVEEVQLTEAAADGEVIEIAIMLPPSDVDGLLAGEAPELESSPAVDLDWKGEVIEYSAGERMAHLQVLVLLLLLWMTIIILLQ